MHPHTQKAQLKVQNQAVFDEGQVHTGLLRPDGKEGMSDHTQCQRCQSDTGGRLGQISTVWIT